MDFAAIVQMALFLAVGAAAMYAYLRLRPDEKVAAAKEAAKSLANLSRVLGSDDSDEAKRARAELKLQLDKIHQAADKLPESA